MGNVSPLNEARADTDFVDSNISGQEFTIALKNENSLLHKRVSLLLSTLRAREEELADVKGQLASAMKLLTSMRGNEEGDEDKDDHELWIQIPPKILDSTLPRLALMGFSDTAVAAAVNKLTLKYLQTKTIVNADVFFSDCVDVLLDSTLWECLQGPSPVGSQVASSHFNDEKESIYDSSERGDVMEDLVLGSSEIPKDYIVRHELEPLIGVAITDGKQETANEEDFNYKEFLIRLGSKRSTELLVYTKEFIKSALAYNIEAYNDRCVQSLIT